MSRRDPKQWDKIENVKAVLVWSALIAAYLVFWAWMSQKALAL